jgi:hypothetical protein
MARSIKFVTGGIKPLRPNPQTEIIGSAAAKRVTNLNTPQLVQQKMMDVIIGKGLINVYEVGRKKDGAFSSAVFQKMMKEVGWISGQYWCMYYAKAVYFQMYSFDRKIINQHLSGGTLRTFRGIQEKNNNGTLTSYIAIPEDTPQVGDILILKSTSRKGGGHAAIITEVIDNNTVKTIEGNTSLAGSRSGQGVYQLTRRVEVGKRNGNFIGVGYIRRVFTDEERSKLTWDDNEKTFIFSNNPTPTIQPTNIINNIFSGLGKTIKDVTQKTNQQIASNKNS